MKKLVAFGAVAAFTLMILLVGFASGDWSPRAVADRTITLAIPGILAALVWFVLFSGRVRTANKAFRAKVWHALFLGFFGIYVLGLAAWLTAGLIPAIAHHVPGLHTRLHEFGGAPNAFNVAASEIGPFSVEGSRRIREMTLRAGDTVIINFTNAPDEAGQPFQHNLSIRDAAGRAIFVGETIAPTFEEHIVNEFGETEEPGFVPVDSLLLFTAPPAGEYIFRCDVHPDRMQGRVLVLEEDAASTRPLFTQGWRDMARRMAEVSHQARGVQAIVVDYLFSVVVLGLGVFLVILRPRERTARVFGVAMVSTAAAYNLQSHAALVANSGFDDPLHQVLHPLTVLLYIYALVLFPDGKLIPRLSGRLMRIGYRAAVFIGLFVLLNLTGSALPDFGQHPAAFVLVMGMVAPVIGIVAQGVRMRRAVLSETRQQSRLLVWAMVASLAVGVVLVFSLGIDVRALIEPTVGDPTAIGEAESRAFGVFQPLFIVIPIAIFVGILRYRLWDVDLVVSRTLVYGSLAGFIGALYVGIVVGLGGALGGRTELTIVATILAAVAFDPIRTRVQRLANRLVYGQRSSPYEVMAEVSRRIAGASSPEEMLPVVAETAARAVGAASARVRMTISSGDSCEALWPTGADLSLFDRVLPVAHLGEEVGEIAVAKRPGDPLRPAENRLLEALAGHVGTAMQSVRLAEQLRARLADLEHAAGELAASRSRLMNAADEERRRLEKLIHEGVETELVAIGDQLAVAERAFPRSRAHAIRTLEQVADQANHTQETLRDLARGIFPPLLTDRGVQPAIESLVRKLPAPVTVTGSLAERFDSRAEAAVYFCCIETLRRASRGHAGPLTVDLGRDDGWVRFAVRTPGAAPGHGDELQLLIDRVEAVGGSIEVREEDGFAELSGRVPVQVAAAQAPASRSGSNAALGM